MIYNDNIWKNNVSSCFIVISSFMAKICVQTYSMDLMPVFCNDNYNFKTIYNFSLWSFSQHPNLSEDLGLQFIVAYASKVFYKVVSNAKKYDENYCKLCDLGLKLFSMRSCDIFWLYRICVWLAAILIFQFIIVYLWLS